MLVYRGGILSAESEGVLPPWAVEALVWIVLAVTGLFTGTYAWLFKDVMRRVKSLEGNEKNHATALSVTDLEMRMAPMISRTELLSHLDQLRDDQERRNEQLREDQRRMHQENRDDNAAIRSDNAATRNDIRAVHSRVDELFSK